MGILKLWFWGKLCRTHPNLRRKSRSALFLGCIRAGRTSQTKGKGRDFGYALAIRSCEGANSVEACTITALDVITAFAVLTPAESSQTSRFFRVRSPTELPRPADYPAYFGLASFI